ncbi:MAG: hypothetical protein QM655_11595 [Nocardioidaceae bacterium]
MVAVLLNPPTKSTGVRSRNAVARAAQAIGYPDVVLTNLCAAPTPSVVELNALGGDAWDEARAGLERDLTGATAVLAAWGVAGLTGGARRLMRSQVRWLTERVASAGIERFWMVGGEPRHPSRWHQYVSDKYGRTTGGSFEERICQVLLEVPLSAMEWSQSEAARESSLSELPNGA